VTTINSGVLSFAKASAFYNSTTGAVSAATINNLIVNTTGTAAFGLGGTGDFTLSDLQTLLNASTASVGFLPGSFIGIDTSGSTGGAYTLSTALPNANGGANATGLMKVGTGSLTLTTPGTYTGPTAVANGNTVLTAANALILNNPSGLSVPGDLQVGNGGLNGAIAHLGASQQIADTGILSFVGTSGNWGYFKMMGFNETVAGLSSAANGVIENMEAETIATNVTLTVNNSANHSYTGYIRNRGSGTGAGTLALTKQGTGTQTLVGANITYTGPTALSNGTLLLQDTTAFASAITLSGTGILESKRTASGFASRSPMLGANVGGTGTININNTGVGVAGAWTIFNPTGGLTMAGTINVNSGTLSRDSTALNVINTSATVNVAADAAFGARGGNATIGALNGTGKVAALWSAANIGTITIGNGGGTGTFSGTLHGSGNATDGALEGGVLNVVKTGTGTQTLAGTGSTYTGTTMVNGGTLLINGTKTGAGAVTVATTATLGGTGNITGAVTVQSGGTLAPGASAGTISFPTGVNLEAGSTYAAEIAGAASFDRIVTSGTLTINGTVKVTLLGGYVPAPGAIFDLADAATIGGTPTFDFTAATLPGGMTWDTTAFATNGTIKVNGSADPFNTWATTNNVTEGKSGDDDKDGISNLLEFATAADPKNGGSGARVYPLVHMIGGQQVLTYTTAVRASAAFAPNGSKQQADKDGVRYLVEATDNFAAWNSVVVTELAPADAAAVQAALGAKLNGLDAAWQWHTFRTDGDLASDPADFIRLNVTEAP